MNGGWLHRNSVKVHVCVGTDQPETIRLKYCTDSLSWQSQTNICENLTNRVKLPQQVSVLWHRSGCATVKTRFPKNDSLINSKTFAARSSNRRWHVVQNSHQKSFALVTRKVTHRRPPLKSEHSHTHPPFGPHRVTFIDWIRGLFRPLQSYQSSGHTDWCC